MIEIAGTLTTILAVYGVILNNRKRIGCFYVWLISNLISAGIHLNTATYSLVVRDVIFMALAIEGIVLWRKKC